MKTLGYILMTIGAIWVTLLAAVFVWSMDKEKDLISLGIGLFIFMLPGMLGFLIGLILKLQSKKPIRKSIQKVNKNTAPKKVVEPIQKLNKSNEGIKVAEPLKEDPPEEIEEPIDYRYESNRGYWNVKCTWYSIISILLLIGAGIVGINERWMITIILLLTSGIPMYIVYKSFQNPD